jgi:hypothetical protein
MDVGYKKDCISTDGKSHVPTNKDTTLIDISDKLS